MLRDNTLLVGSDGYIGSNCPFGCDKIDIKGGQDFLKTEPRFYKTIIFLAARLGGTKQDYLYNERLYNQLDRWLVHYPDTHVIYSSSAAIYGEGDWYRKENEYPNPIGLYGITKLSGEFRVRDYDQHTVLRFANVYGKMNGQPGHGVTEIFQGGYSVIFGDGNQIRDFVPIEKIWEAIELAKNYPEYWQGVFNVSLSEPITINTWFKLHGKGKPKHIGKRKSDIHTSILDSSKMRSRIALCQ